MIRSRDLVLFVLALFFLGVAIFVTIAKNNATERFDAIDSDIVWKNTQDMVFSASSEEKKTDRSSIIERLKRKIEKNQTIIEPVQSREEKKVEITINESKKLNRCDTPDDSVTFSRTWPLENISVSVNEGARTVLQLTITEVITEVVDSLASNTTPIVKKVESKKTLLQLPLIPVQLQKPACVPSEIVGVTIKGSLIFNGDAVLYRSYSSDDLIGYARDGFPIYGPYKGDVDECGGYVTSGGGYRYSASTDRPYLLGCYRAEVQSFIF